MTHEAEIVGSQVLEAELLSGIIKSEGKTVEIGNGLKLEDNVLSVDTADIVEKDNTKPVTSAAVYDAIEKYKIILNNSEEWELIQDVTLEDDCLGAFYTTDLNGEPFELKKAIVFIERKPTVDNTEVGIGINLTKMDERHYVWGTNAWYITKTNDISYTFAFFEDVGEGRIVCNEMQSSYNESMHTYPGNPSNLNTYWQPEVCFFKSGNYMNSFNFGSYTVTLGAGTRAMLYGIRK